MFGTDDLSAVLGALSSIKDSDMPDEDKAACIAVVREEFFARAHGDVLHGVVDRLTTPPPPPEPEAEPEADENPVAKPEPKAGKRRGRA